jgi:hypothetical protein
VPHIPLTAAEIAAADAAEKQLHAGHSDWSHTERFLPVNDLELDSHLAAQPAPGHLHPHDSVPHIPLTAAEIAAADAAEKQLHAGHSDWSHTERFLPVNTLEQDQENEHLCLG